ncbi:hypothetical protein B0H10DRAFT_986087 [Mycena sp. CBHHK59/15]|nr:hypothetical protein B0H10DRAFT_986087 [Mycena sp. CBHHK59/15]
MYSSTASSRLTHRYTAQPWDKQYRTRVVPLTLIWAALCICGGSPSPARSARRPRPLPENFPYSDPDGSPRDCTRFGNVCEQPLMAGDQVIGRNDTDVFNEDCLLLNIWVASGCLLGTNLWKGGRFMFVFACFPPCQQLELEYLFQNSDGGWLRISNPCHDPILDPVECIIPTSTVFGQSSS